MVTSSAGILAVHDLRLGLQTDEIRMGKKAAWIRHTSRLVTGRDR